MRKQPFRRQILFGEKNGQKEEHQVQPSQAFYHLRSPLEFDALVLGELLIFNRGQNSIPLQNREVRFSTLNMEPGWGWKDERDVGKGATPNQAPWKDGIGSIPQAPDWKSDPAAVASTAAPPEIEGS